MAPMPSYETLQAALNQTFRFFAQDGQSLEGRLFESQVRIAIDDAHFCYSALFELPVGAWLPQDIYRVVHPSGEAWDLLLTPYRPTPSGACVVGAVFHVLKPDSVPESAVVS